MKDVTNTIREWELTKEEVCDFIGTLTEVIHLSNVIVSPVVHLFNDSHNIEIKCINNITTINVEWIRHHTPVLINLNDVIKVIALLNNYYVAEVDYKEGDFVVRKGCPNLIYRVLKVTTSPCDVEVVNKRNIRSVGSYRYEKWYPKNGDDVVLVAKSKYEIVSYDSTKHKAIKVFPYGFAKAQYYSWALPNEK